MEAKNIPSQINFFKDQFMPYSISGSYTLAINLNEPNSVTDTSTIINLKGTLYNFEITCRSLIHHQYMRGQLHLWKVAVEKTITKNSSAFRVRAFWR